MMLNPSFCFQRQASRIVIIALCALVGGCTASHGPGNTRKEHAAMSEVLRCLGDPAVSSSEEYAQFTVMVLEAGPLDEGIAVLIVSFGNDHEVKDVDAAFWVRDDVVYTVNEKALELAPGPPQAPAQITIERVREVVH